ncbi:MAG: hypothetical protein JWO31_2104 [Phycisphaerales bacterium]|nr:hypothetical protein [Phycisphaerales bacterium]
MIDPPPTLDYRPTADDAAGRTAGWPMALGFGLSLVMSAAGFGVAVTVGSSSVVVAVYILLGTAGAVLLTAIALAARRRSRMVGAGMFLAIGVGGLFLLPLCGR